MPNRTGAGGAKNAQGPVCSSWERQTGPGFERVFLWLGGCTDGLEGQPADEPPGHDQDEVGGDGQPTIGLQLLLGRAETELAVFSDKEIWVGWLVEMPVMDIPSSLWTAGRGSR